MRHSVLHSCLLAGVFAASLGACDNGESFQVGGTLQGYELGSLLVLQCNDQNLLNLTANGFFRFAKPVANNKPYEVTVLDQPTHPPQLCEVINGSGIIAGTNVTNILVECGPPALSVGGMVTGLAAGEQIVLVNNGADDLLVESNGPFTFESMIKQGSQYRIRVLSQPSGADQFCAVHNGTGTMGEVEVTDVEVSCADFERAAVTAGYFHSCAIATDGTLACWGDNSFGQSEVPALAQATQVDAGKDHTCVLYEDGSIGCWGSDAQGQSSPPAGSDFVALTSGDAHACALRQDGALACWGDDAAGQSSPPAGQDFIQIQSGAWHTCGLREDGSVACWGDNRWHQCEPIDGQVDHLDGQGFVQVSPGQTHTCALRSSGSVACMGAGNGAGSPPAGQIFASLCAGGDTTCGVVVDGSLTCWGRNDYEQNSPPAGTDFLTCSAGYTHVCAARMDGSISCWGRNNMGQTMVPTGLNSAE